jgi:hypothetical protein
VTVSPSALDPKYQQAADTLDTAAQQQMKWNRPNTANPWSRQYSDDAGVHMGFTGPMAGAQGNLTAEALRNMSSPTDFSQFNVGTGDDFRNQAISGAQGQMDDWLAPLQGGMDSAERQRLLNAGYEEGSPQFQAQMQKGAATSGDLRSTLKNAAIGLGTEQGAKMQGMDLLSKQQGLAEALRKRSLPMEQLSMMQGLTQQPGFNADGSIVGGAAADLNTKLGNYWRQRGMAEQEREAADQTALGVFGAASSFVPVIGGFANGAARLGAKK